MNVPNTKIESHVIQMAFPETKQEIFFHIHLISADKYQIKHILAQNINMAKLEFIL